MPLLRLLRVLFALCGAPDEVCLYDEAYDCDGPSGTECEPYDCIDIPYTLLTLR